MSDTNLIQLASRISSLYNQKILDAHKELLKKMRIEAPNDIKTVMRELIHMFCVQSVLRERRRYEKDNQ